MWSFLQVRNNQTKNNGYGGGAASSPGAKGAAPPPPPPPMYCMLNFPARMQIRVDRASFPFGKVAELKRDLQSLSLKNERTHLTPFARTIRVCGFKVRHFHLNWHELGSSDDQGSALAAL